jgi:hypothetical protein
MYVCHLLTNLVEKNDIGFQECLTVERCPHCGLRFTLMWVGKLASCKHFYHCWCVTIHFSSFSKCIKVGCEEKMHEMWWRGGCKVGWLTFCITIQFFCRVACIYMLLTWHKNNNFPNLWLDLDFQLEEEDIYKKILQHISTKYIIMDF